MSKIDMSPPQTYSRLFRPWDSAKNGNRKSHSELSENNVSDFIMNAGLHEHQEQLLRSKLTESEYNSSAMSLPAFAMQCNSMMDPLSMSSASAAAAAAAVAAEYYFASANGLLQASPSPSSSSTSSMMNLPTLPPSTSPSAGLPPMMDPLALSFMEHEYVRVMAEDAHLKALNARKQRPKKFKCPHCDVAFSNNGQLKGHIRIHTGERPFKCDLESCAKTFTRNEELTRHKRIHTGLRPYACSNCGKKFGRRDHLKKHMKTHMPQERHLGAAIYVPMYPYLYGY